MSRPSSKLWSAIQIGAGVAVITSFAWLFWVFFQAPIGILFTPFVAGGMGCGTGMLVLAIREDSQPFVGRMALFVVGSLICLGVLSWVWSEWYQATHPFELRVTVPTSGRGNP